MRGINASTRLHTGITRFQYVLIGVGAIMAFSIKADPIKFPFPLGAVVTWTKGEASWAPALAACLLFICQAVKNYMGWPWGWDMAHYLLDELRSRIFTLQDPAFQHRVTLFRHKRFVWCCRLWPWSGWLVPVERSLHMTRNSKVCFRASDEGDHCEGVAGWAWATRSCYYVANLPDLRAESPKQDIEDYAKQTHVPAEWIQGKLAQNKFLPRSLYGIPVEKSGKLWGVIVIDSRHKEIMSQIQIDEFYERSAGILSRVLEKV